jgi:hypothetical protein
MFSDGHLDLSGIGLQQSTGNGRFPWPSVFSVSVSPPLIFAFASVGRLVGQDASRNRRAARTSIIRAAISIATCCAARSRLLPHSLRLRGSAASGNIRVRVSPRGRLRR